MRKKLPGETIMFVLSQRGHFLPRFLYNHLQAEELAPADHVKKCRFKTPMHCLHIMNPRLHKLYIAKSSIKYLVNIMHVKKADI